jgi:WD40 repeat protein/uncharacterized caspase-like protein
MNKQANFLKKWDFDLGAFVSNLENINSFNYFIPTTNPSRILFLNRTNFEYWDLNLPKLISSFNDRYDFEEILILPNDTTIIARVSDNTVRCLDLNSGKENFRFPMGSYWTEKIILYPETSFFLSMDQDGTIEQWDLNSQKQVNIFKGHRDWVEEIIFLPKQKSFLTRASAFWKDTFNKGKDYSIRYWNLETGKEIFNFLGHEGYITQLALLPDSMTFLSSSRDGNIIQWNLKTGEKIKNFNTFEEKLGVTKFVLLPNNKTFLAGYGYGQVIEWDIETREPIKYFSKHKNSIENIIVLEKHKAFLSTANYENVIRMWSLSNDTEIHCFQNNYGQIKSIHLLPNNKQFLTINEQNSITLWDLEKKQEIVTLIPLSGNNQDYVLVTPDGRFDGTPEGMKKLLHFVVGNEVVELEQLKDRYYEPGLWKKLLGYSNEPLRNIQDIKDKGLDLYPETILKLNDNKLTIKLLPRSGGVGKVSLFVGNKRIVEDLNPQRKTEFTVDLKQYNKFFSKGQADTLGIVAYEREGTLPSRPEIVEYEADLEIDFEAMEKEKKRQSHFYGVFIGTSNYQDGSGLRDLAYPVKDAQDLSKAMQLAAQNLLISPENVQITLLSTDDKNNLPSKANIRKVLEGLAQSKDIRKEDVLVVYFSGHGVSYTVDNKDQFFYITQDLSSKNLDDKVVREAFTISTEEIAQWMVNVVARKQVLILDACASGKAVEQAQELLAKKEVPTSQKRALELLKDRTGIFVISGSTSDASSYEASPYGQGFLTYALLSGITGGALQNGEYVDVMSLFQYAANRVPEIAEEFGVIQQPQIATPSKVNSFPIGKVGEKEKKAIQIAQPKPFFVRSSFFNPEENEDNLALADLLNQSIRENMGAGRSASAIFFDVNNHPQGYKIIGNYSLNGNVIQVKWQIKNQKTGEKSKEFSNEGDKSKLNELAESIFKEAVRKLNN